MNESTLKAALDQFGQASNHAGDAATAINLTATGLVFLTGLVAELTEQVEKLRSEIRELKEQR